MSGERKIGCQGQSSIESVYAGAVKTVIEEDRYKVRDPEMIPVSMQRPIERAGNNMCFSKVGF